LPWDGVEADPLAWFGGAASLCATAV
jgi:hypothetical protein